jgi:hypothetical protein
MSDMTTTTKEVESAFPFGQISELTGQPINGCFSPGMSLRDYFAAKALQGLLAHEGPAFDYRDSARMAYGLADAMLKAREAA